MDRLLALRAFLLPDLAPRFFLGGQSRVLGCYLGLDLGNETPSDRTAELLHPSKHGCSVLGTYPKRTPNNLRRSGVSLLIEGVVRRDSPHLLFPRSKT
jgi:hypothetical protein